MASTNVQSITPPITAADSAQVQTGNGSPNHTASKGTLYIQLDGSSTTTRLYINTDGGTTWANFTASA